jgi:flavin-binding protein dodecin
MAQEKTIIPLKNGKTLTLQIRDFGSSDIDIEDLLQIDMNNIMLDIITFPVIFNRIANIKAEIDDLLRSIQYDMSAFEAQLYEQHKKALIGASEKATENAIDMAIKRDPKYKIKKYEVFEVQRNADIIDGLYWAAKSKDQKLNAISAKIKPEEFEKEILEGEINSVVIRSMKSTFKSGPTERINRKIGN